ncbi:MAG: AmmeMemoRadiSam system protein B [Desulfatitalea sp.]|nr:AmmeMemoRadiSam system protein B [Desulfatitalea sp.]NNJ99890.1 AmmeMemoRadiSam system protein B [Desulfatitalea sp.]
MKVRLRLIVLLLVLVSPVNAEPGSVRPAVWDGKFYPGDARALRQTIDDLVQQAARTSQPPDAHGVPRALVLPHAGYIYSGLTAAHAHRVLKGHTYAKVILMGPDHRVGFANGAVSAVDAYQTPLGKVPVHPDARRLCSGDKHFRPISASDRSEHCLEVVLPFLQYSLDSFSFLPVVLGPCEAGEIAAALAPLVDARTLVVISADLSHHLPYDQASARDRQTIQSIISLDAASLVAGENRTCGKHPMAVLLHMARRFNWRPVLLHYANSGDTAGDKKAVVGYAALAFYGENPMSSDSSPLTAEQGSVLLRLARDTLNRKFGNDPAEHQVEALNQALADPDFKRRSSTFVTLKIGDNLRGCIGSLTARNSLAESVRANAVNAAFHDPRFHPLQETELAQVNIEVSVLTQPQPLTYADGKDLVAKLRPGVDGVILRKGNASATFLPQVWEQLPRPEAFLGHLCAKAGLPAEAWRQDRLEVEIYQVQYFEEPH